MAKEQKKSFMDQVKGYFRDNLQELAGQAKAALREGAKDLHNAIVPAFPGNVHGVDEPGTPLSPTQFMVNKDLGTVHGFNDMVEGYAGRGNGNGKGQEKDRGVDK